MCEWYCAVLFVLICLGGGTRAFAQVERASIVGTIRDSTGSVVQGVAVKVINQATDATENLQTDSAGDYSATNLTPGTYSVEAEKSGFTRRVYRDFVVQVAQVARLDITLAGARATNPLTAHRAKITPRRPPAAPSRRLSVSNCRTTRQRAAPRAARTAISWPRELYRASSRFATFDGLRYRKYYVPIAGLKPAENIWQNPSTAGL